MTQARHAVLAALLILTSLAALADVALPGIFSDHMVLQRGIPVAIWGTAAPGERVTVSYRTAKAEATAGADGTWRVKLGPLDATPVDNGFDLTVVGRNTLTLTDVLVGEVWLGSGQSNMVWPPTRISATQTILKEADIPRIRLSSDTLWPSYRTPGGGWVRCTPRTVEKFSALMYYFGRDLQRELGVPVGLIGRAVSGSAAGPWISPGGFMADAGCQAEYKVYCETTLPKLLAKYQTDHAAWEIAAPAAQAKADAKIANIDAVPHTVRLVLDGAVVKTLPRLVGDPERVASGIEVPLPYDGKEFVRESRFRAKPYNSAEHTATVTATRTPTTLKLALTLTLGDDPAVKGGAGRYTLDLKRDGWSYTGIYTGTFNGEALAGTVAGGPIRAKDEMVPAEPKRPAGGTLPGHPGVGGYYTQFIEPVVGYGMRGILWDQGESGTGLPDITLPTLIPAMATDWRRAWGVADLPFFFVQKPSGGGHRAGTPVAPLPDVATVVSAGGYTREYYQKLGATPDSAMAICLDLDGALHPDGKEAYAKRLLGLALARAYGRPIVASGPRLRTCTIEGDAVRLAFDSVGGGLMADGGALQGFMLAGPDRKFRWATASIEGKDTVVLRCPEVPAPASARYAWAGDPVWANLTNKEGLPAVTFRTDDWPKP